ncbi:MAG: hypothetical protein Q9177_002283 [Variospora cf. flavescens]
MKRRRNSGSDSTSSPILPEQRPLPRSPSSSPEVPSSFGAEADTLPLTSENLRQLPDASPRQVRTTSAMSTSSTKTGANVQDIGHNRRRILDEHLLFLNKWDTYAAHPEIQAAVDRVVNIERGSEMKPESAKKLQIWVDKNEREPEKVFFAHVWAALFKHGRLVKTDDNAWVPKDWEEDHFRCNPDMPFYQKVVTGLSFEADWAKPYEFEQLLDRIKDPKPDLCLGLTKDAFTNDEMRMLHVALPWAEVSTGLYCGFAAVEFKGPDHYITDAEDQATRSGSTLVECSRQIQAKAGSRDLKKPGADTDNIIFSLCMNQVNARLFVHWALVGSNGRIEYHMNRLWKGDVLEHDNSRTLRRHLNSIVDWGLLKRKSEIVAMLPNIAKRALAGKKSESSSKAAKHGSNSSAGAASRAQAGSD